MNYYNENDKKAAAWLRELIKANLIANGEVDERSITEVHPNDLVRFTQCHFFAGIGGWSYALRLAGWPDDKPVWTGSCPCQPFSQAGQGLGEKDARHLWPVFRELIRACKPATVFGEQVASAAGRLWLSGVFANLEAMEYQRAAADLCAAGVKSPHIRQRLFWVGYSELIGREQANGTQQKHLPAQMGGHGFWSDAVRITCADKRERRIKPGIKPLAHGVPGRVGLLRGYGNAIVPQLAAEFIQAFQEAVLTQNPR